MIDLGISKMALIGAVALIVIGPEKLPRVARTVGTLLGKAQRYVSDVKAEVNRAMDLDELKKMKETVEEAGREVEKGIYTTKADFEKDWNDVTTGLDGSTSADHAADHASSGAAAWSPPPPEYRRPDNDTLLRLYALYKQGAEGDVSGAKPGFFDFVGTAKYEAWAKLKGTAQDEAKRKYVDLVKKLGA